ncbi:MAG: hypothetical protein LH618_13045 [Saprospiraceae bacterium]|nr:hypothetical protein [Saprospiraceae bacterium]
MRPLIFPCCFFFLFLGTLHAQERSLDYYLAQGLQYSPVFRDLRNQETLFQYDSLLIRAAQRPQVTANSAVNVAPTYRGFGYDPAGGQNDVDRNPSHGRGGQAGA